MFKSAIVYRIAPGWEPPSLEALEEALDRARFAPCSPTEPRSAGWVEPRGKEHGALAESVGGQLVLSLRTEVRAVPGSAVRDALEDRLRTARSEIEAIAGDEDNPVREAMQEMLRQRLWLQRHGDTASLQQLDTVRTSIDAARDSIEMQLLQIERARAPLH